MNKNNTPNDSGSSSEQTLNLEEIMQTAIHHCDRTMRSLASMSPAVMVITRGGIPVTYSPEDGCRLSDMGQCAELFATYLRAQARVVIFPEWSDSPRRRQVLDLPPSEFPDCKEIIFITVESREGCARLLLFPLRNAAGDFTGFASENPGIFDEDFLTGIFPEAVPTDAEAAAAGQRLRELGVKIP